MRRSRRVPANWFHDNTLRRCISEFQRVGHLLNLTDRQWFISPLYKQRDHRAVVFLFAIVKPVSDVNSK